MAVRSKGSGITTRDEEEWSEDYTLGALDVTISSFTVATMERWLDAVTLRADTDPVKHMRLAAIQRCRPLVERSWQAPGGTGPIVTRTSWSALAGSR